MSSLVSSIIENKKWYPQSIEKYEAALKFDIIYNQRTYKKNFAYNMQYIEYLNEQIIGLDLSSVLYNMTFKTFVINIVSVIELIFYVVLKNNNLLNFSEWKELIEFQSNQKNFKDESYKVRTKIYKKVEKFEEFMIFDTLIKKIRDNKILRLSEETYSQIEELRKLRNKIHLQNGITTTDHDYNNFAQADINKTKVVLYRILTCEDICLNKSVFDFLET